MEQKVAVHASGRRHRHLLIHRTYVPDFQFAVKNFCICTRAFFFFILCNLFFWGGRDTSTLEAVSVADLRSAYAVLGPRPKTASLLRGHSPSSKRGAPPTLPAQGIYSRKFEAQPQTCQLGAKRQARVLREVSCWETLKISRWQIKNLPIANFKFAVYRE